MESFDQVNGCSYENIQKGPQNAEKEKEIRGSSGKLPQMGEIFTPHMVTMEWKREFGWSKPEIGELKPLQIHPAAKCLHYAIEVFEGLKAHRTKDGRIGLFRPELHLERLNFSTIRCALPPVDTSALMPAIEQLVNTDKDWIPEEVGGILYIRLGMIGTEPTLLPKYSKTALFYAICTPGTLVLGKMAYGATLYVNPSITRTTPGIGEGKMGCNYTASVVPLKYAEDLGCQEILWLFGENRLVTECCGRNVFVCWINEAGEKEVVTPSLEASLVLNGITRRSIMELLKAECLVEVREGHIYFGELEKALEEGRLLEVFITGTATGVAPVKALKMQETYEHPLKDIEIPTLKQDNPIWKMMLDKLTAIQLGKIHHPWFHEVC